MLSALLLAFAIPVHLATPVEAVAQERATLFGTLFDQQTRQPLPGGSIVAADGVAEARSAQDGSFVLEGLPAGRVTVRMSAPGYTTAVEQVELVAGQTEFHQFAILPLSATLGEVMVLANRLRGPADSSAEVDGDSQLVASSAADLLAQRVPGLTFSRGSGDIGSGSSIIIRGVGSITQSTAPAIFLDGVRLGRSSGSLSAARSDPSLEVLDAIPASDVKRIRVLRGSSASAAYGDSANGIILIETRRDGQE